MSDLGPRPTHPSIVVEHRPDPDRPDRGRSQHTIRGARRYDGVLSLFGDRSPEFHAAERYRDDNAIAAGVRLSDAPVVRFRGHTSGGPSDAILDALERVAAASHAMGRTAMPVVIWVVLGNQSLASFERTRRTRHGASAATLRLALAALADHYDRADGR